MPTTIYRKYRPQRFADLVGQMHIRTTLTAELESGKLAHAYLFIGPRGIGKTTTARLLAKALNCASPEGVEPDNRCTSCVGMNEGRSLDLIEIDAASHTQVDHVRENILPAVRTAPTIGKYKVFIIDEVHMLSASAFAALLKALEEPPAHVIFILATTEPHRVPETIVSRCQRFTFRRIEEQDIVLRLSSIARDEGVAADRDVLGRVAHAAGGSLRDAESILGQLFGLHEKKLTSELADLVLPRSDAPAVLALAAAIMSGKTAEALQIIQRLVDEGVHLGNFQRECIEVSRALLLLKVGIALSATVVSPELRSQAQQLADRTSIRDLQRMVEVFMQYERQARTASIPQLPLELAVVELSTATIPVQPSERASPPSVPPADKSLHGRKRSSSPSTTGGSRQAIDIAGSWPEVLTAVQKTNPSLAFLLKTATPRGIVDGTLTIVVPYQFHRERLVEARAKATLEAALSSVLRTPMTVDTVVAEGSLPSTVESSNTAEAHDDVWDRALRAFGGRPTEGTEGAT